MAYPNVALGRRAWQSSVSPWSKGSTIEDDASGATNGDPTVDYAFCTRFEKNPWWIVDLEGVYEIKEIHVYNRRGGHDSQIRASPILIETSLDNEVWSDFFRADPGFIFGGDEPNPPLACLAPTETHARYVRISVLAETWLHLAEVEVYGEPTESPAGEEPSGEPASESDDADQPSPPAEKKPSSPPKSSGGWLSFLGW